MAHRVAAASFLLPLVACVGADPTVEAPTDGGAVVDGGAVIDGGSLTDSGPDDGGVVDGGGPSCVLPAPPASPCVGGTCASTARDVKATLAGLAVTYPHGLAIDGDVVYTAVQEATTEGRNGGGRGVIARVNFGLNSTAGVTAVSGVLNAPGHLAGIGGTIFWTQRSTTIGKSDLIRAVCLPSGCTPSTFATVPATEITAVIPLAADRVVVSSSAGLATYSPAGIVQASSVSGRAARSPGGPIVFATRTFVGVLGPNGALTNVVQYPAPLDNPIPVPGCSAEAVMKVSDGLLRPSTTGTPVACTAATNDACSARLAFDLVADGGHLYAAMPDGIGLRRYTRSGNGVTASTLLSGDLWDVALAGDSLYVTDVNGGRLLRVTR